MAFLPDLLQRLGRLLSRLSPGHRPTANAGGRHGRLGMRRWPGGIPAGLPGRWRHGSAGSALVQALMAGLIAVIGGFLLASRLLSSRFNSFSRSDTLAAREAAEYGLNEVQAQLNSNQLGYLWVTQRNNWDSISRSALTTCQVSVLDASGNDLSGTTLPTLPDGIRPSSAKTIRNDGGATITYTVSDFQPPELPLTGNTNTDNQIRDQAAICGSGNGTTARNFGNLNGGSALITVTGTVTRNGTSTSFRVRRRSHVASPAGQLRYSFMILGNARGAYVNDENQNIAAFGDSAWISKLNRADGNICYGTINDDTCFTTPEKPRTIIGCYDLESCIVNNITNVSAKDALKNCSIKTKKKKKKGYVCNEFQQASPLPAIPTPTSEQTAVSEAQWPVFAYDLECSLKRDNSNKRDKCKSTRDKNDALGITKIEVPDRYVAFPYIVPNNTTFTLTSNSIRTLTNSNLVRGCYFSNTSPSSLTAQFNESRSINCLVQDLKVKERNNTNASLTVYTRGTDGSRLPYVNLFLHGTSEIKLEDGGIANNDDSATSRDGWSRLRLLGKAVPPLANGSIPCNASSRIKIKGKKGENDLNNLFLWLPNAHLDYSDKKGKNDSTNSYMVAWVCEFTGPTKDKDGTQYSIITPIPENVARDGLFSSLGSSFIRTASGTYRGFGSEDTPLS